jgi:hypothetical protein
MHQADSRYASYGAKNIYDQPGRPDHVARAPGRSRTAAGNPNTTAAAPGNRVRPSRAENPRWGRACPGGRI